MKGAADMRTALRPSMLLWIPSVFLLYSCTLGIPAREAASPSGAHLSNAQRIPTPEPTPQSWQENPETLIGLLQWAPLSLSFCFAPMAEIHGNSSRNIAHVHKVHSSCSDPLKLLQCAKKLSQKNQSCATNSHNWFQNSNLCLASRLGDGCLE